MAGARARYVWRTVMTVVLVASLQLTAGAFLAPIRAGTVADYTTGRVVHYDFKSIVGTTVPDISGRGNHGTLYNFGTPAPTQPGSNGVRRALVFDRSFKQRVGVGTNNHTSL